MSDFAKYCPKCYTFFSDLDLYTKHVEVCGFAKDKKTADSKPPSAETTDRRRQTATEKKRDGKQQTAVEPEETGQQFSADTSGDEPPSESAADCDLPSVVAPKAPKFKT
jgi:hypothetical protein